MGIRAYARFWGVTLTNSLMKYVASAARYILNDRPAKLFALVIGINTYNGLQSSSGNRDDDTNADVPTFTNLRGAVADAQDVYDYLASDLGVPKSQITFLLDEQATRTNIIAAFRNLANNKDIKEGDSIFIYYAGHGAQTLPPKRLLRVKGCPETVEVLVPHDYGRIPSKHESMGIPDYSIGALLNQIAEKKGDNITVVFDCSSHSASTLRGSRDPNPRRALTRSGPDLMYHLPDELDRDIWDSDPGPRTSLSRGLTIPSPLKHFGSTSYVFFAACSSSESAREMDDRGCFTSALMALLRKLGHSSFSCSQLVTHLPKIEGQSPQCEGIHQDRLIFHGYVSAYDKTSFNIAERPASVSGDKLEQEEPTAKVEQEAEQAKLFALVIGINNYKGILSSSGNRACGTISGGQRFPNLRGAVADAQEVYDYLISDLEVPPDHITCLRDDTATRKNIIDAFKSLASNEDINKGDSIFIYYAGHGSRAPAPDRLKGMTEMVEILIPHDYDSSPSAVHETMGIPDYTVGALLNQIAQTKGDNITIVFDCCHSASALRGSRDPNAQLLTRSVPDLTRPLSDDLDRDIWGPDPDPPAGSARGLATLSSLKHFGSTSYVFFAACSTSEEAREKNARGCFTSALIALLKKVGHGSLSCSQLIDRLPEIEGQSPQCEGVHQARHIFHGYVSSYDRAFFDVTDGPTSTPDNSYHFTMKEGRAHGLSKGDELTIYKSKSKEDREKPVGIVVIDSFDDISGSSRLQILPKTPTFHLPCQPAPALLTNSTKTHLKLHIASSDQRLQERIQRLPGLSHVLVTAKSDAYISISVDRNEAEERLCFEVVDQDLIGENRKLKLKLKPRFVRNHDDDLRHVLNGLAHYYWHLKRTSDSLPATKDITMSLLRVQDTTTGQPRFIQSSREACTSNVIDMEIDEKAIYGLELTNNSGKGENLFPVLFYFDNTEFTITQSYKHPIAGIKPESPWPERSTTMTIGYGVGSGSTIAPFSFYMDKAYDTEVGFFKLMLSNKPIDLENMVQEKSPFTTTRGMKIMNELLDQQDLPIKQLWGSITLTIITRRKLE